MTERLTVIINHYPLLSRDEERRLFDRWRKHGSRRDLDRVVGPHYRYVLQEAHKYSGYNVPLEDLFSVGVLALHEAAQKYKPEYGVRVLSYAQVWIKRAIREAVIDNWSIVPLGKRRDLKTWFLRMRGLLRTGDTPTVELAKKLGASEKAVQYARDRCAHRDAVECEPSACYETLGEDFSALHEVTKRISSRSTLHREIISWLSKECPGSMASLARRLGRSSHEVYRLRASIVKELRDALEGSV